MVRLESDGSWSKVHADQHFPPLVSCFGGGYELQGSPALASGAYRRRALLSLHYSNSHVFCLPDASPTQLALHLPFPADPACSFQRKTGQDM